MVVGICDWQRMHTMRKRKPLHAATTSVEMNITVVEYVISTLGLFSASVVFITGFRVPEEKGDVRETTISVSDMFLVGL